MTHPPVCVHPENPKILLFRGAPQMLDKEGVWALNPLNPANNLDAAPPVAWYEYTSLRHAAIFRRQCAHAAEVVRRSNRFDNGGNAVPAGPTPQQVDQWQTEIAQVIRETERALPNRHLISGQEAFAYHLDDESQRGGPGVFHSPTAAG